MTESRKYKCDKCTNDARGRATLPDLILYLETLDKLMELLHETKDNKALHKNSMQAITIEPNSPSIICWLIIALRKHGALDMANKHMESAKARLLSEEYRDLEFRLQAVK